jgi:hypothetical protein
LSLARLDQLSLQFARGTVSNSAEVNHPTACVVVAQQFARSAALPRGDLEVNRETADRIESIAHGLP